MKNKSVIFTVPGEPRGKARPKVTKNGTYTPKETKDYEYKVAQAFLAAASREARSEIWMNPLTINIVARFGVPKSASKSRRKEIYDKQVRPMKKPDIDNIAKIVLDGLQGTAYHDDDHVCELRVTKEYVVEGMQPHVVVFIGTIEPSIMAVND